MQGPEVTIYSGNKAARRLVRAAFPTWRGEDITVSVYDGKTLALPSVWAASRRYRWGAVQVASLEPVPMPAGLPLDATSELPAGVALVELSTLDGTDATAHIYLTAAGAAVLELGRSS